MHRSRFRPALACAAVLAIALTGCTTDEDEAGAGTTTATTAAPTTTEVPPASTEPTIEVAASRYRATIQRTTGNVPHITAPDLAGAVFGQGWANAEDHACTLADQVLKVKGERAKWLGAGANNANVDSDFAWRAIGIHDLALADWPQQPADIRDELTAYAAGWNAYLDEVGVDGLHGWCKGQPWVQPITPEDLFAYARSVTLLASSVRLTPYLGKAQPPSAEASPSTSEDALGPLGLAPAATASNGWAIGEERTTGGGALLLANPHFPWEGELRFWEVHLRVPGETDIYGVQLIGLPGVGIGFNDGVAWTHTVSAGRRFTVYDLDLVPGDPTSYLVDGQPKQLTSNEVTVEVAGGEPVTRTLWASEYGPVLDFPGIAWNTERVATYRDANLDNDEFAAQYLAMDQATNLDALIAVHERYQGVPLFNTIAVGADGRAWYADTSATPNLSAEAIASWEQAKASDPIVKLADEQGVTVLDGSTSATAWVDEPGARDPGLVPYAKQPKVERTDYLFNANDSFWIPNADHPLEGDYSPLHGLQRTARSPRTRQRRYGTRSWPAARPSRWSRCPSSPAATGRWLCLPTPSTSPVPARCSAGGTARSTSSRSERRSGTS